MKTAYILNATISSLFEYDLHIAMALVNLLLKRSLHRNTNISEEDMQEFNKNQTIKRTVHPHNLNTEFLKLLSQLECESTVSEL